ncbi:hypothetical protein, variant [Verruconis gallopava]|nr:hypothetical protein, variant [Verruconis gallopava]KIW05515.1 hypothetical protein, variant [Verruconis gallopava]
MQYHALSVVQAGGKVRFVGYVDSDPHPDITRFAAYGKIAITPIKPFPKLLQTSNKLLFPILAPLKVLWQTLTLYHALGYRSEPSKWMIVQNPPSIPTLVVAQIICFLRNTKLIIDWHNFGYSILAVKLGNFHPLVNIAQQYEFLFSRAASYHFSVTYAMADVLRKTIGITALPVHDRPPNHFQPLSELQRNQVLERLPETAPYAELIKSGTTKLIVSSTSWTCDEDFSILLDALVAYSARAMKKSSLPRVLAIITGKGPEKDRYVSKIARLKTEDKLVHVDIMTAWLSMEDYARLLGAADVGISLHKSSSGVDLPMKVVDMFGTGLPVFGFNKFQAWPELVKEDVNGKGFASAGGLSELLVEYLSNKDKLQKLREGAMRETRRRWQDEWKPIAGRLLGFDPDRPDAFP